MAEKFNPQNFNINSINGGNRYKNGDGINADTINSAIEASAYAQALATNQPDTTNANNVGTPTVSIQMTANGTPQLKFENLKGEEGLDGIDHSQEIGELYEITGEQGSQIDKTKKEVHNIKQALFQNEVLVMSKDRQAYTVRQTANGENIVDEQLTYVLEIKGSTVADRETNTLKHAYIKSIKSTGRNIINPASYDFASANWHGLTLIADKSTGDITISGELTDTNFHKLLIKNVKLANGKTYTLQALNANDVGKGFNITGNLTNTSKNSTYGSYADEGSGITFTVPNDGDNYHINLFIVIASNFVAGTYTVKPMLYYGTEKKEFEPYTEELYEIPQTLELGEWDSFNPQTGELIIQTKRQIFTGDEKWIRGGTDKSGYYRFYTSTNDKPFSNNPDGYNAVSNLYNSSTYACTYYRKDKTVEANNSWQIFLYDSNFAQKTEDEWVAYVKSLNEAGTPLTVDYKLATPTITKIENTPKAYMAWNKGTETVIQGDIDNSKYEAIPTITNEYILKIGGEEQ